MKLDLKKYISKETQVIYNPIVKKEILNLSKKKKIKN